MTGDPHPFTMTTFATQRRAELQAEVAKERMLARAERRGVPSRSWFERSAAAVATVLAFILVVIAGSL